MIITRTFAMECFMLYRPSLSLDVKSTRGEKQEKGKRRILDQLLQNGFDVLQEGCISSAIDDENQYLSSAVLVEGLVSKWNE